MKRIIHILTWGILLASVTVTQSRAQSNTYDPTRVATVQVAKIQEKNSLKKETAAQDLMTAGYIATNGEMEKNNNFQRQFNAYVDSFRNVIQIAAEVFGIYYEVRQITGNINRVEEGLTKNGTNPIALAIHNSRGSIYTDIYQSGISIMEDIKKACFSKAKLTEKERLEIIGRVRPKLRTMNRQLVQLATLLHYTTFLDIWNEITGHGYQFNPDKKRTVIEEAMEKWKNNAGSVRSN